MVFGEAQGSTLDSAENGIVELTQAPHVAAPALAAHLSKGHFQSTATQIQMLCRAPQLSSKEPTVL